MPQVFNQHHRRPMGDAVYVGRPTKWGNPFSHMEGTLARYSVKSRDEAIAKYREWVCTQPKLLLQIKQELRNKNLACWCSPHACHADVLLEIANE